MSFVHFLAGSFVYLFYCWDLRVLQVFYIPVLVFQIGDLQIYSPSLWFIFILFQSVQLSKDFLIFMKSNLSVFALMDHIVMSILSTFCLALDTQRFSPKLFFVYLFRFVCLFVFPYGSAVAPAPLLEKAIFLHLNYI